jgi:hypothetical protein
MAERQRSTGSRLQRGTLLLAQSANAAKITINLLKRIAPLDFAHRDAPLMGASHDPS